MKIAALVDVTNKSNLNRFIEKYSFVDNFFSFDKFKGYSRYKIKIFDNKLSKYDWIIFANEQTIPNIHLQQDARWFLENAIADIITVFTIRFADDEQYYPRPIHGFDPRKGEIWAIRPNIFLLDNPVEKTSYQLINIPYCLNGIKYKNKPLSEAEKKKLGQPILLPYWIQE